MAVFSNDPRIQGAWNRVQQLNTLASAQSQCSPTQERVTDLCRDDDAKRNRLGAACIKRETITVKCEDYSGPAGKANQDFQKLLKDTAKEKARIDKQAAEFAAEQAILTRRRATNASLEKARIDACGVPGSNLTMNVPEPRRTALLAGCHKARVNESKNAFNFEDKRVTFDEVARELGASKASGNKPAKLKKKSKAAKKAAAKLKKKNR